MLFNSDARRVLEKQGVSERQYLAYFDTTFRKKAFLTGVILGDLAFILCFFGGYYGYSANPEDGLLYLIIATLFGFLLGGLFLGVGMMFKNGTTPTSDDEPYNTPKLFEFSDVLNKTDHKFIKNISPTTWQAIKRFDLKAYEVKEQRIRQRLRPTTPPETIAKLNQFKLWCKRVSFWNAVFFFILFVGFVFVLMQSGIKTNSLSSSVFKMVFGLSFLLTTLSVHFWFLIYALLGFLEKKIIVPGEWGKSGFVGLGAQIWAVVFLGLGVFDLFCWLAILSYVILSL
ncbi:MAG: hypothetical protein ABII18_10905 [bacterium]|nr:hypothetical protein [bacterium]MBU1917390.1 hypothetical protein [bacterium]